MGNLIYDASKMNNGGSAPAGLVVTSPWLFRNAGAGGIPASGSSYELCQTGVNSPVSIGPSSNDLALGTGTLGDQLVDCTFYLDWSGSASIYCYVMLRGSAPAPSSAASGYRLDIFQGSPTNGHTNGQFYTGRTGSWAALGGSFSVGQNIAGSQVVTGAYRVIASAQDLSAGVTTVKISCQRLDTGLWLQSDGTFASGPAFPNQVVAATQTETITAPVIGTYTRAAMEASVANTATGIQDYKQYDFGLPPTSHYNSSLFSLQPLSGGSF